MNEGDQFPFPAEEITEALIGLHKSIIDILNDRAELEALTEPLERWRSIRQKINDRMNIGLVLGVGWKITHFPLTGDITRDAGQINFSKLEEQ